MDVKKFVERNKKLSRNIYYAYVGFMALVVLSIVITPVIAFFDEKKTDGLYWIYSYTCHQKMSRSFCLFEDYSVRDCAPQNGSAVYSLEEEKRIKIVRDGLVGYKFPVCSRCISIYLLMLIGGLVYPMFYKIEEQNIPKLRYFVLALVPIGLDGGIQLLSYIGVLPFHYESTNLIRFITGGIAGFASSFYIIPLLMNMIVGPIEKKKRGEGD